MADESTSVQIAVRMRPFNDREKALGTVKCVQMEGQTTVVVNPMTGDEKSFGFNYCYDSFDPDADTYASQDVVYNDLGVSYLENAWQGYNCSIFAYGQTGSGKSYSMTGYGDAKGIIPLGLEEMFRRIEANDDENIQYRVEASYLEIYMEKIRDLFNPKQSVPSLKVRESPKLGVFVEDLRRERVGSYDDISRLLDLGNKVRTVAQTNMNATSSRSHSVLTVYFTQTRIDRDTMSASDMTSKINLVDLAGSERQDKTGASGQRLKEGSAINQSLTALGNVIEALADRSVKEAEFREAHGPTAKFTWRRVVPYRDSKLTRILQESLGGNAKTIMVAAISPAGDNYAETLSTLRYASRASKIQNVAIVNESPNEKVIRELREEVERLRKLLENQGISPDDEDHKMAELEALRARLEEQDNYIQELQMTAEERGALTGNNAERLEQDLTQVYGLQLNVDRSKPHLINLNDDPLMNESLVYFLKDERTTFGRDKDNDVVLGGVHLLPHTADIVCADGVYTIEPEDGANIFVKGVKIDEVTELHQGDRVIFGNNHFFRFNNPEEAAQMRDARAAAGEDMDAPPELFDFEFAFKELVANNPVTRIEKRDGETTKQAKERMELEEMLMKLHPQITEANAIAEEMARPVHFALKLVRDLSEGVRNAKTTPKIKVSYLDQDRISLWSLDKFSDKLYEMKDMYINFSEYGVHDHEHDLFDEPPEDQLIGLSHVLLEGLPYCISVGPELQTPIVDYDGADGGMLIISIFPVSPSGEIEPDIEDWCEEGTRVDFQVHIHSARGLPAALSYGTYAKFKFLSDTAVQSDPVERRTINPDFDFSHTVTVEHLSDSQIDWLESNELIIEVWGNAGPTDGASGSA